MLLRTHFTLAILILLLFLEQVEAKAIFVIMVLVGTIFPDLDDKDSSFGRYMVFRPFQMLFKHRGALHSLTFAALISIILAVFFPIVSFGFFLGYAVHLFADSFTRQGIQPFWPFKIKTAGPLATGGRIEESIFFTMIFINIAVFFIIFVLR